MAGKISTNPLLQTDFIGGLAQAWVPQADQFLAEQWYPMVMNNTDTITIDEVIPTSFGLTLPAVPEAESTPIQSGALRQWKVTPGQFREKVVLRRHEMVLLRKLGTHADVQRGEEIVAEKMDLLMGRVYRRMEKLRWDVTSGTLAVNENNVSYSINFQIPAYRQTALTGNRRWNQAATAQPVNDIMDILDGLRGFGHSFSTMVMNKITASQALRITQFRTLFQNAIQGGLVSGGPMEMSLLQKILQIHIPEMPDILVFDGGYDHQTPTTAFANAGAQQLVVDDPTHFAQNETVTIVHPTTLEEEQNTLNGGPAGSTLNLITPLGTQYPEGTMVRVFKPYIPDGWVYFMPARTPEIPSIGNFHMIPTEWAPGSLTTPKPGIFFEVHDHQNEDPKRIELIAGFAGMPAPRIRNAHHRLQVY